MRRWRPWLAVLSIGSACGTDTEIKIPAAISVSRTAVALDARISAPATAGLVTIINGTAGTLDGLQATVEYPAGSSDWLATSFDRTTATQNQAATLSLTPTPDGLDLGPHLATVRVTAADAGNGPIAIHVTLTVRPRPPAKIVVVTGPPAQATNGAPLGTAPVVQLLDNQDQPALESGVTITASVGGGGSVAAGSTAVSDAQGRATFDGLTILGPVGAKTLSFDGPNLTGATSAAIALAAGPATRIEALSQTSQTANAGAPVADPPRVQVVDQSGNPIAGYSVTFGASAGSTIVPTGPIATGANGAAGVTNWTLKPAAGTNTVTADAAGLQGSPVTFTATGQVGPPAHLAKQSGDNLTGIIGTALGTPHVAIVTDLNGNGVGGVTVTWAAAQGGGSVNPAASVTDANGLASTTRTLGPTAGPGTTTASASIGGTPVQVVFAVTAANAGPATIVKVSGDDQSAPFGTVLAAPIKVQVVDAANVAVANVPVTFTTAAAGGSFPGGATINTDASGFAATTWKLGTVSGVQSAQAAVGGPAPVVFHATALAGPVSPTLSTVIASPATIAAGAGPATVTVTAVDGSGNPVTGATVVLAISGGTGLTQPAGPTGTDGKAAGSVSSTTSGARIVSATVNGVALTQTATVTIQPAAPAQLIALSANPITGVRFNSSVGAAGLPRLKVVDAFGNAVPNVTVSFSITSGYGTVAPASVLSSASGQAAVGSWSINDLQLSYALANVYNRVQASVAGAPPLVFTGVTTVSYDNDLQFMWNLQGCGGCHSGAQVPYLGTNSTNSYAALVTGNQRYVVPGDSTTKTLAKNLLIYWPTAANPHSGGSLPDNLLTIIAAWIKQGAPHN